MERANEKMALAFYRVVAWINMNINVNNVLILGIDALEYDEELI